MKLEMIFDNSFFIFDETLRLIDENKLLWL